MISSRCISSFHPIFWLHNNVSVNSKPDYPPGAPGDSHILVAPGVGFLLLCLARGSARGVLNQSKSSIILKKARFFISLLNNWVAAPFICLYMLEVSSMTIVPIYIIINTQRIRIYPCKLKFILVKTFIGSRTKKTKLYSRFLLLRIYPDSLVHTSANTERIQIICPVML